MLLTDVQSLQHTGSFSIYHRIALRLSSRSFLGSKLRASHSGFCRLQRDRRRLCVRANELNKWGDRDARDDDSDLGVEEDGYDRDTMLIMLKVLTARAVQRVLMQLSETDLRVAQWLTDFCAVNSPMTGDAFVLKLLKEKAVDVEDKINQSTHTISPTDLADIIIVTRHSFSKNLATALPKFVAIDNLDVYKRHLESSTFIEKPPRRRGRSS